MNGVITAEVQGHGTFRVHAKDLDWAIDHFLPASPAVLRSLYEEWTGKAILEEETPTVSEFLVMLTSIARGDGPQDEPESELTSYTEVARIIRLTYVIGDPGFYSFTSGEGYDKDGRRVMIKPPSNCEQISRSGPASYLLRHWPDIKEQVPEFFVWNALVLEGG